MLSKPVRTCGVGAGDRAQRPLPPRNLVRWDAGEALCRLLISSAKPCKRS